MMMGSCTWKIGSGQGSVEETQRAGRTDGVRCRVFCHRIQTQRGKERQTARKNGLVVAVPADLPLEPTTSPTWIDVKWRCIDVEFSALPSGS